MDLDLIESLSPEDIEQLYDDVINNENDRVAGTLTTLSGRCSDGRIVNSYGWGSTTNNILHDIGYCTYNTSFFHSRNFAPCGGGAATVCVVDSEEETSNTKVFLRVTCDNEYVFYMFGLVGNLNNQDYATVGHCTYNTGAFGANRRPECNGVPAEICVERVDGTYPI